MNKEMDVPAAGEAPRATMDARVTRRTVCTGLAALASAQLVGACGLVAGRGAPSKTAAGSVLFWPEGVTGAFLDFWPKADAAFREAFPAIQYQRETRPSREGTSFPQLLVASAAAGSAPDVYQDDVVLNRLQLTVPAGIPRATDEYYVRFPNLKKVFPWTRRVAQLKGKTWGIPHEVEFVSVFYNKPALAKVGVTRPAPQTWDEFQRLGRTLTSTGIQPLLVAGISQYRHLHGYLMAAINGKQGMDEIVQGNGRWDAGACVDAAQIMLDLGAAGVLPRDPFDSAWAMPGDFYNGRAAQTVTGTWSIGGYERQKRGDPGFDFGQYAIPSPKGSPKPQLTGGVGGGFSITTQAKTPDAAATFIDFLYSPPMQKLWIEIMFHIPPVPFKVEDYDVSTGNREALTLIHQFEQAGMPAAFWMVQTAQQFEEYGPLIERVLKKQLTPKDMGLRMQQLWDEFKRDFR